MNLLVARQRVNKVKMKIKSAHECIQPVTTTIRHGFPRRGTGLIDMVVLGLLLMGWKNPVYANRRLYNVFARARFLPRPIRYGFRSAISRYEGSASSLWLSSPKTLWRSARTALTTESTQYDVIASHPGGNDAPNIMMKEDRCASTHRSLHYSSSSASVNSVNAASLCRPFMLRRGQSGYSSGRDESIKRTYCWSLTASPFLATLKGGATVATMQLVFWETMLCGAISRSTAQTVMHPANTMKTILQNSKGPMIPAILELCKPSSFHRLTYGAGTNFLLSLPTGAVNFAVLELVRKKLGDFVARNSFLHEREKSFSFVLDFLSSSVSTVTCSVVATPQMMIIDNIMVGNYPNLRKAVVGLYQRGGVKAFYRGWLPGIVGKIPSYALTWTLFQQFKALRDHLSDQPATNVENSVMGAMASAMNVCIMIPLDTIKTRLVVQGGAQSISTVPYKGICDCAVRTFREEGIGAFYRGLPPRLVSVVPMIAIQFAVYEAMKTAFLKQHLRQQRDSWQRTP